MMLLRAVNKQIFTFELAESLKKMYWPIIYLHRYYETLLKIIHGPPGTTSKIFPIDVLNSIS